MIDELTKREVGEMRAEMKHWGDGRGNESSNMREDLPLHTFGAAKK
jgi:hypothetical protein